MLIYNKKLSVVPITTHIDIRNVPKKLKSTLIINKMRTLKKNYKKIFNINPKIGVLGLNPHNAEFSKKSEEIRIIHPVIKKLKKETDNQVLKINESVDKEFKISSERRSKAFQTGLKQIEDKIRNDLKREILQKTVVFTELRIKKELKKKHNSSFIEESLKKLSDHI